jgi:hypothetical protein
MNKIFTSKRVLVATLLLGFCLVLVFSSWLYTVTQLQYARSRGVFPTALEGKQHNIENWYVGIREVRTIYAGPNFFDGSFPHVWYIISRVYAEQRGDGTRVGWGTNKYDTPGGYWLNVRDGWVQIPESAFPELIGFFMKIYGLAGPGDPIPEVEWPSRRSSSSDNIPLSYSLTFHR